MVVLLTILHVLICIFLVMAILLQASRGGGLAGMFGGGGGMGQIFGSRGTASFLSKITLWLGIGFAVTSISIALFSPGTSSKPRSLLEQVMENESQSSPATMLPTVPGSEQIPSEPVPQGGK